MSTSLSTGIPAIDDFMDRLECGQITEWSGPIASGKTQLALATCLYTAVSRTSGLVYFFDSGAAFSARRLQELWRGEHYAHARSEMSLPSVLSRIVVVGCYTVQDLHRSLKSIARNTSLIIIDSVSDILSPLVGTSAKSGSQSIAATAQFLKSVAKSRNIPIVAINACVGARTLSNDFVMTPGSLATNTKPALGYHWATCLSKRIYFTASLERQSLQVALLSGAPHETDDVLTWETPEGHVFLVIDWYRPVLADHSNLERVRQGRLRTCTLYIGKHLVHALGTHDQLE
ncbi:DNA repair protein rad51d [Kappamyces sp. JEL0680]|nr:DNA repair protein rad51d [Kappamyces sp. JEL0680]